MKILMYIMIAAFAMMLMPGSASAQSCTPSWPPGPNFYLGQSFCVEICGPYPWGSNHSFFLVGDLGGDATNFPILLLEAGCNIAETNCNVDCNPLTPPSMDWDLGGDPLGFYPDWHWIGNECMEIVIRWAHDGFWDIVIIGHCDGCFCLSFESQLAVELSSFTATGGDGEVNLSWSTASENDNDHFEIIRDGDLVRRIDGAGTAATGNSYSWTDTDLVNGTTYSYSLVSVDVNGIRDELDSQSATPIAAAGVITEYALLQNYPNPFNPETSIAFDLVEAGTVTLTVYNLAGQEVATIANGQFDAGHHVVEFDGGNLTSGVYFYTMRAGDFSAAKKLVLMK